MTSVPPSGHSQPLPPGAGQPDAGGLGHVDVFSPAGIEWTPVAPALASLRRVLLLAAVIVVAILVGVLGVVLDRPVLFVALVLPAGATVLGWGTIGRQIRAYGYAERSEDLLIRKGLMFRSMVVVPYGRMQFVDVQAGPLERVFGIAQVQLHTASAGTDAVIPGVREEEAARLRDRLASRGQARLAGL